jgi:hypothetical protein
VSGKRHVIVLTLTQLVTLDSDTVSITARVSGIDNARETVDPAGQILGLPESNPVHSKADWALLALGTIHPVAAVALFATIRGESHERHRTIVFHPGVEMTLRVTADAPLPAWPVWKPPDAVAAPGRLDSLIRSLPPRAFALGGKLPGDLINVVLIGDEADVRAAFRAAGWETADRLSPRTGFDTFVAMAGARGYAHQPVSKLVLDGRPPDIVFQKLTDTFAKRHHARVWHTDSTWDGRPIFVMAATHDVGLEFSTAKHTFTHRIDPHIDLERDKIVNDLLTAKVVTALSLVPRTPVPDVTANGRATTIATDWHVAVVALAPAP